MDEKILRKILQEETEFDEEKLYPLWNEIKKLLLEEEEIYNLRLAQLIPQKTLNELKLSRNYVSHRILPEMRNLLEDNKIIEVEERKQKGSSNKRKVWRLKNG